ncbi:MAG: GDP-mannose 4,6-dehydratase [Bdellovibrionales bacterium]|nr:GDP-mannose 4,6-dehydratase [Bdellovibrionales bacterium]
MKVVVTGGAGFIGSHCVDALLKKGCDVTVIDDFSSGSENNLALAKALSGSGAKLTILRASIADPSVWTRLGAHDAIFHFAAQTSVTASVQDPRKDFDTNVACVPHILGWIRQNKVKNFLYANTAGALYGDAVVFPTDERSVIKPESPYGVTKAFMEMYLGALTRSLKSAGEWSSDVKSSNFFSWVSLRLGNIYGPRQVTKGEAGVVPIFFETLVRGERPTIFGDGKKTRDYVFVGDVIRAFMAAFDRLQQTAFDEFFNVGTSIETKDIELFDSLLRVMHGLAEKPPYAEKIKPSLKVKDPHFASIRPGEIVRSQLNIGKIDAFLAWQPKVSLEEGLRQTVEAYCQ